MDEEKINDIIQLTTISLGTLIIFHKTDYEVSNVMMSIEKGLITLFPERLGKTFNYNSELIPTGQFKNIFNNKSHDQQVTIGRINIKSM